MDSVVLPALRPTRLPITDRPKRSRTIISAIRSELPPLFDKGYGTALPQVPVLRSAEIIPFVSDLKRLRLNCSRLFPLPADLSGTPSLDDHIASSRARRSTAFCFVGSPNQRFCLLGSLAPARQIKSEIRDNMIRTGFVKSTGSQ